MAEHSKVNLSFKLLPEARVWKIGTKYRVELVLKQLSMNSDGAEFEIVDARSMSHKDKLRHTFMTGQKYAE